MSYALFQLQLVLSAQLWHTLPEARSKHSGNHGKKTGSVYPWNRWWEPGWASLTLLGVWLCVLTLPFDTSFLHLPAKAYHLLDLSNLDFLTLAAVEWLSKSLMFYCKQSARTVKVEVMVSLNSFSLSRRLAQKSTMTLITWMKKWGSRSHSLQLVNMEFNAYPTPLSILIKLYRVHTCYFISVKNKMSKISRFLTREVYLCF